MPLNLADFLIEKLPANMKVSTIEDAEVHEGLASLAFDTVDSGGTGVAALTHSDPLKRGYISGRFRTTMEIHPLTGSILGTSDIFSGFYLMRSDDPDLVLLSNTTTDYYTVGLSLKTGVFNWVVNKHTNGISATSNSGMTEIASAVAVGIAVDVKWWVEVLWLTDIIGPKIVLNVGTEAAWANMTEMLNHRDTNAPLVASFGEGPIFWNHSGSTRRVVIMDSTAIDLYEPVVA